MMKTLIILMLFMFVAIAGKQFTPRKTITNGGYGMAWNAAKFVALFAEMTTKIRHAKAISKLNQGTNHVPRTPRINRTAQEGR